MRHVRPQCGLRSSHVLSFQIASLPLGGGVPPRCIGETPGIVKELSAEQVLHRGSDVPPGSQVSDARYTSGIGEAVSRIQMPEPKRLACRRQPERPFGFGDPAPDGGITVEVKTAFMRDPGIGQQRDVGERDRVAGQERRQGELVLVTPSGWSTFMGHDAGTSPSLAPAAS